MRVIERPLPSVVLLEPKVFKDNRGDFVKTFNEATFIDLGIAFSPVEEFYSTSHKNVLRGMHFQLPPNDHAKLVYCIQGKVLDVLVDLRKDSTGYGKFASAELSAQNKRIFFIPTGIAHGFLSLEDDSIMVYKTTTAHAPVSDAGIRWDSFGFNWPEVNPIFSTRDAAFPELSAFKSPF